MKKKSPHGKPALDLIEEAVHLLRGAPLGVHVCYYTGTAPFVLALLYFWSDMCRGAYAYDRVIPGSFSIALLFVWMKCWQSVAASKLLAQLSADSPPAWTARRIFRLIVTQAALQPSALFIRPVALLLTLPYAWTRSFYENAVILGDGSSPSLRELIARCRRQAGLWPRQNNIALSLLFLFGFLVWLNIAVILCTIPALLKMFAGIGTVFTENPVAALFNTTFLAASLGCAYLCVNPVTKAFYVLRCFYGESLHSGDDLKLQLRRIPVAAAAAMVLCCFTPLAHADAPAAAATPASAISTGVDPSALNDSIERVLKRDEFAWRMPRQLPPVNERGFMSRLFDDFSRSLKDWIRPFLHSLGKLLQRLSRWMSRSHSQTDSNSSLGDISGLVNLVLWILCAVIVVVLAWLIWANRRGLRGFRLRGRIKAEPLASVPDLNSEEVMASQLPEDEWLKLARDLIQKGEYRLAARALYLATLAHLGLRELIAIARYKSNRDYQRELGRRARSNADLLAAFGENVTLFEGVWYGAHETTEENLRRFSSNFDRIKAA